MKDTIDNTINNTLNDTTNYTYIYSQQFLTFPHKIWVVSCRLKKTIKHALAWSILYTRHLTVIYTIRYTNDAWTISLHIHWRNAIPNWLCQDAIQTMTKRCTNKTVWQSQMNILIIQLLIIKTALPVSIKCRICVSILDQNNNSFHFNDNYDCFNRVCTI